MPEPHGENRATLGKHLSGELRRCLRDQSERNAIFASLPGDAGDRPGGRAKTDRLGCGNIAMRLFADEEDWRQSLAVGPEGKIEGEPADQRYDDVGNLGRYAG